VQYGAAGAFYPAQTLSEIFVGTGPVTRTQSIILAPTTRPLAILLLYLCYGALFAICHFCQSLAQQLQGDSSKSLLFLHDLSLALATGLKITGSGWHRCIRIYLVPPFNKIYPRPIMTAGQFLLGQQRRFL